MCCGWLEGEDLWDPQKLGGTGRVRESHHWYSAAEMGIGFGGAERIEGLGVYLINLYISNIFLVLKETYKLAMSDTQDVLCIRISKADCMCA